MIQFPTFVYKQRLDKDDWNNISANAVNGYDLAQNGDDIHQQYIGSLESDDAKIPATFRKGSTGPLAFTNTPVAFGAVQSIDFGGGRSDSTTDFRVHYIWDNAGTPTTAVDTFSLTWDGDPFPDNFYFSFGSIFLDGADYYLEAFGIRPRDPDTFFETTY